MSSTFIFQVEFPEEWTSEDVHLAVILIWKFGVNTAMERLRKEKNLAVNADQVRALCQLYDISGYKTPRMS